MADEGRILDQKTPAEEGFEPAGERNYNAINETNWVLSSEDSSDETQDTVQFPWNWLYGKFLSVIRSYLGNFTEDDFNQSQMIPNVLYTAANKTQTRNSEAVTFLEDGTGGFDVPLTGNITFDFTDAKNGVLVVLRHNSPTEPTFSQQPIPIGGTGYQTGVNNLIFLRYIFNGTNNLVYSEIVQENAAGQQIGGTVDGHTHPNLSVLNNITNAGSGEIITQAERDKITSINEGFKGWYANPTDLNTAFPTATLGDSAIVGTTDTFWVWDGVAWVDSGSSSAATTITDSEVKTKYENNANTNAFTDAEKAKLALLTPNSYQTIPNIISANVTAVNDRVYHNTASATYTDPTPPIQGRGFVVRVINGTATIGGVGYTEGYTITRFFHSGSWRTKVYHDRSNLISSDLGNTAVLGSDDKIYVPSGGGGGGGGGWSLEQTVTATGGETQLQFTGLNGDADDEDWMIEVIGKTTSGNNLVGVRINNDAATNYKYGSLFDTALYFGTGSGVGRLYSTHFNKLRGVLLNKQSSADAGGRGFHCYAGYSFDALTGGTVNQVGGTQSNLSSLPGAYMLKTNILTIEVIVIGSLTFAAGSEIRLYKGKF